MENYSLTNVDSIECIYSGACNLTCQYCCIHKNPENMYQYNDKVRQSILDGKFQSLICEKYLPSKERVKKFSMWGGEPTINADLAEIFLYPILDFFPKIDEIFYSTNASIPFELGNQKFIDCLSKYSQEHNRKIRLSIQFSIDGPEYMTDVTRNRKGITQVIKNNALETAAHASKICTELFAVSMITKSTVDAKYWPYLLEENHLLEWYKFFNDFEEEVQKVVDNPFVHLGIVGEPTLVSPAEFSKQDGINYAKLIKKMRTIDISDIPLYEKHPLTHRYVGCWKHSLGDDSFFCYGNVCSAGTASSCIDYEGTLMNCHRFYDDYKMGGEYNPAGYKISVAESDEDIPRIDYVQAVFHSTHHFRQQMMSACLLAMAHAGEIEEKYTEPYYRNLLFTFLGGITCYVGECGSLTHCQHMVPISNIRLLCNGALEELADYYEQTL